MDQKSARWPAWPLDHSPYENRQENNLFLITGDRGAGKTTWCQQWVELARTAGWRVGGLLSPSVIASGQKIAIDLVDLSNDQRRRMATLRPDMLALAGGYSGRWLFDPATLQWGNGVLGKLTHADLLIIDELGPLEFERKQGLQAAFDLLGSGRFLTAGIVIRPTLLSQAQRRWPWAQTIPIFRELVN